MPSVTPEATRVYAVGDVHGRSDLLAEMLDRIALDAISAVAPARLVLVMLGDYVDRGPDSKGVINLLSRGPLSGFESVFIKGNHESMLLDFVEGNGDNWKMWLANGGMETLESYGIDGRDLYSGRLTPKMVAGDFIAAMPDGHLDFLHGLSLMHVEGDYAFAHAGVRPGVAIKDQTETDLLWIRGEFLVSQADFGKRIVHGHTIENRPEITANRIGIDTGAFKTGCLTCLVLEDDKHRFLFAQS